MLIADARCVRPIPAVLFAAATCALAQFSDIAVTDDAGQIYFVSSVPLRGESNPGGGIYRWSGERWEQFVPPFPNSPITDPFRSTLRVHPVVSGGGTVVAWWDEHRCSGGSRCISNPTYWDSVIATADGQRTPVPGKVQISRNGRYVIQGQEVYVFSRPYQVTRKVRDLQTGTVTDLDFEPLGVLSDGRVLGSDAEFAFLWTASGGRRRIPGTEGLTPALISDYGNVLIASPPAFSRADQPDLTAVFADTGRRIPLGRGIAAGISNDGFRALVLSGYPSVEALVVETISGTHRPLAPGTGIVSGALAGFGHTALLATTDGRLLRVDLDGGETTELISRTPVVALSSPSTACSALQLTGSSLSAGSAVTLDGETIPVIAAADSATWVQVPCELQPSDAVRSLELQTSSPFATTATLQVHRYSPLLISLSDQSTAVHQDFSGPVTQERPAQPGEVVHLWGTGFGPVNHPMRTGEMGPVSPLARLLSPPVCRDNQSGAAVEVLYAGLAPGLVGIYQLDIRVPMNVRQFFGVGCAFPEETSIGFYMSTTAQP